MACKLYTGAETGGRAGLGTGLDKGVKERGSQGSLKFPAGKPDLALLLEDLRRKIK